MELSELVLYDETPEAEGINLAAVTKMKHAALWQASKQFGGQAGLARHLKVRASEFGKWVNLQKCPPKGPKKGTTWTPEFFLEECGLHRRRIMTVETYSQAHGWVSIYSGSRERCIAIATRRARLDGGWYRVVDEEGFPVWDSISTEAYAIVE